MNSKSNHFQCTLVRVRLSCAWRENLKIQPPRGLGGTPFFFTSNLILFLSINSAQNFKIVAQPLLGEKFVWVGGWWGWLRVNLVLRFGPNLRLRLWIWTWTWLNNYVSVISSGQCTLSAWAILMEVPPMFLGCSTLAKVYTWLS